MIKKFNLLFVTFFNIGRIRYAQGTFASFFTCLLFLLSINILNIITLFFFTLFISSKIQSETLNEVLIDAYNFYPDISKSIYELETKQIDLKKTKTDCMIVDIVMDPEETILIKEAMKYNRNYHIGKNMLVSQINLAGNFFNLW